MKASVIVPTWNVESYIAECLESVRVQTLGDFECIMVDGGSTDRTLDICQGYASRDSRFTVLIQPNRGMSRARNLGIEAASGDWLYLADPDGRMTPECLEHSLRLANESGIQMVFWNVECFGKESEEPSAKERNYFALANSDFETCSGEEAFCKMLEFKWILREPAYFYALRRDCLRSRFIECLDCGADEIYTIQNLLQQESVGCLAETLYWKRSRLESQVQSRPAFQKILSLARGIETAVDWMDNVQHSLQPRTIGWIEWWLDEKMKKLAREWGKLDEWEQDRIRFAGFRERLLIRKCIEIDALNRPAECRIPFNRGGVSKFQTPSRWHERFRDLE